MLIIAVISSVLASMIQQARESARQTQCRNNLKQFGVGIMSYAETHSVLPPGWISVGDINSPQRGETSAFGWGVYLIPYMDSTSLYEMISPGETSFRTGGAKPHGGYCPAKEQTWRYTHFSTARIRYHRCPSDRGDPQTANAIIPLAATNNYLANFGVGIPTSEHATDEVQGLFGASSAIRLDDIKDGISLVVCLGERRMFPSGKEWPANEVQGNFNSYWAGVPDFDVVSPLAIVFTVTDGDTQQHGERDPLNTAGPLNGLNSTPAALTVFRVNQTANNAQHVVTAGVSSHHPGGCHLLMADGSVRFAKDQISDEVLVGLARRSDGCQISEDLE